MNSTLISYIKNNKVRNNHRNGFYKIGPEFAEELLRLSNGNPRGKDSKSIISKYAQDMLAGEWKENGEPIVIGKDGVLQNGHHRLHAIIKANVSAVIYIIFDAEPTGRYDYGKNRSLKEEMKMSSLSCNISKSLQRLLTNESSFGVGVSIGFADKYADLFNKAEEIITTGKKGRAVANKAMCGVAVAAVLKAGLATEDDLKMFFRVVNTGNPFGFIKNPMPAILMRTQIEDISGGGRAVQSKHLAITYRALMDFIKDRKGNRKIRYSTNDEPAVLFVKSAFKDNKEALNAA